jgi:hypothetical protein
VGGKPRAGALRVKGHPSPNLPSVTIIPQILRE